MGEQSMTGEPAPVHSRMYRQIKESILTKYQQFKCYRKHGLCWWLVPPAIHLGYFVALLPIMNQIVGLRGGCFPRFLRSAVVLGTTGLVWQGLRDPRNRTVNAWRMYKENKIELETKQQNPSSFMKFCSDFTKMAKDKSLPIINKSVTKWEQVRNKFKKKDPVQKTAQPEAKIVPKEEVIPKPKQTQQKPNLNYLLFSKVMIGWLGEQLLFPGIIERFKHLRLQSQKNTKNSDVSQCKNGQIEVKQIRYQQQNQVKESSSQGRLASSEN